MSSYDSDAVHPKCEPNTLRPGAHIFTSVQCTVCMHEHVMHIVSSSMRWMRQPKCSGSGNY